MGNGMRMIARAYGGICFNGVRYIYDYAKDELIKESDLLAMSKADQKARKAASEKAKWTRVKMNMEKHQEIKS